MSSERSPTSFAVARSLLRGAEAGTVLGALALAGQRAALAVVALGIGKWGGLEVVLPIALLPLLGGAHALVTESVARAVRRNVLDAYLGPFENAPVVVAPKADVASPELSVALPELVSWALEGVVGVLAAALAVPVVAFLLVDALGAGVLLPIGATALLSFAGAALLARPIDRLWTRVWDRTRTLLQTFHEGYRGLFELRAHERAGAFAADLRAEIGALSDEDGRARRYHALASRTLVMTAVGAGLGLSLLLFPAPLQWMLAEPGASLPGLFLLLSAVPTLSTLILGVTKLSGARGELRRVAQQKALGERDAPSARDSSVEPRGEIRLERVTYAYPGGPAVPALRDVDLVIPEGASVALVGRNGAGKTTLLLVLLGLVRPESGRIVVGGQEVSVLGVAWRKRIAFLSQNPLELLDRSIAQNLRAFLPESRDEELVDVLGRVGLWSKLLGRAGSASAALAGPYSELSRGESRRVLLARALLGDADLLVLDEPEANLDPANVSLLSDVLREEARRRRVVAAVHDRSVMSWAQHVVELRPSGDAS